jgi:hypothetical protein
VSGIVLGIVAFREKVPASPLLIAVQVAGLIALVAGVILVARSPVLGSLRQYHGPGEHLLHRERNRGRDLDRERDPEQQQRPGPGPDAPPGLIRPGLINPGPASPARGPDLAQPPGSLRRRRGAPLRHPGRHDRDVPGR